MHGMHLITDECGERVPLSMYVLFFPGFQAWAQSTCPELSAQGLVPLRWGCALPTSIESVMPSSHLILCRPLLLLPPIPTLAIRELQIKPQ